MRDRANGLGCRPWSFVALLCLATAVHAQSDPAQTDDGQLIRIYEMTLRPEAVNDWNRMQREEAIPALLEGGYPWVDVWRSGGAGDAFYRSILVPLNDMSELDETALFERVLGAEEAQDLLERHRQLVTSIETTIVSTRPDLGFGTPPATPGVGILTTVTVAPSRIQEFEQQLRTTIAEGLKNANVASFQVSRVILGGEPNTYFLLQDFHNAANAALGRRTATESALGTDGVMRLAESEDSPITSIERVILRYDTTLSAGRRGD